MNLKLLYFITVSALVCFILNACTEKEMAHTLEVSPDVVKFIATGNDDKILTVSTNAPDWSFTKSSWLTATKEGNTLVLNASDNASQSSRDGWLKFTAGTAESVMVSVTQSGISAPDVPPVADGDAVRLMCVSGGTDIKVVNETEITVSITVSLAAPASAPVIVKLIADYDHLNAFNESDLYNYPKAVLLPSENVTLPTENTVTIPAGRSESDVLDIHIDVSDFAYDKRHLLPLHLEAVENAVISDEGRADFVIVRPKPIKNVVIYEVNETNPLNSLEYKLEDGSYFMDAVVLFSSNIIHSSGEPRLSNNANVQALLDNSSVYLQPLRDAGIKVYLGLLGHHTSAGLGNLSDTGARLFAEEVAEACYIYGLDGVFLDDEYTSYPASPVNSYYTTPSFEAASRLCYELKRAMKTKCPWDTEVSYWVYGYLRNIVYPVVDNGVEYPQSSFIDIVLPGYGGEGRPYGDLTHAQCGVAAYELNKGSRPSPGELSQAVDTGFGYCMWFCFHPSDLGTISNNRNRSLEGFRTAAKDFYGLNVLDPQYYYDKLGEGSYDPTPHAI